MQKFYNKFYEVSTEPKNKVKINQSDQKYYYYDYQKKLFTSQLGLQFAGKLKPKIY